MYISKELNNNSNTKGILLAGGAGTRLLPLTSVTCKQLLPIYDKPMIYYPLTTLMLTGVRDILIISTPDAIPLLEKFLGDGSQFGINLEYKIQDEPKGIAEAFLIGEDFIGDSNVNMILGDNIFYGAGMHEAFVRNTSKVDGATVFATYVKDPERFGVIDIDENGNVLDIIEKPKNPPSHYAVTGLYFYDNKVVEYAKNLQPSARGELEITDINKCYLNDGKLKAELLGRGNMWLDVGTQDSMLQASSFISHVYDLQGLKIGSPEEIAWRLGYISKEELIKLADNYPNEYGAYLKEMSSE